MTVQTRSAVVFKKKTVSVYKKIANKLFNFCKRDLEITAFLEQLFDSIGSPVRILQMYWKVESDFAHEYLRLRSDGTKDFLSVFFLLRIKFLYCIVAM